MRQKYLPLKPLEAWLYGFERGLGWGVGRGFKHVTLQRIREGDLYWRVLDEVGKDVRNGESVFHCCQDELIDEPSRSWNHND